MRSVSATDVRLGANPVESLAHRVARTADVALRDRRLAVGLSVSGIVIVGLIAKLPEAVLPIGSDTGMFATYARLTLHGARPYVDFFDIHPPLTLYYWVLVEWLAGSDWTHACVGPILGLTPQPCVSTLANLLDLTLTFVAAGLTYGIARRLDFRPTIGAFAALLVVWFANESMISMEGSTPTKLTLVPSTLAVFAYLRSQPNGRIGWALVSGSTAMLGVLTKQPALMTLLAIVVDMLPGLVRGARSERRLLLGFSAGALIVLAPALAYLGWIGSLGGFLDQPWSYNLERFVAGYWQTPGRFTAPATRIDLVVRESGGLLFIGAALGGITLLLGPATGRQRFLLLWGLFSLVAIAGFREFAQVVPPFALLAAVGVGRLWQAAADHGLGLGRPMAGRLGLIVIFGSIFLLTSGFQLTEWRRAMYERRPGAGPADPELIAAYLRESAPPGPIFAWANAAQIYALSGREPASRFVIAEFTDGTQPRAQPSRALLMDDLRLHPPAAIVLDAHSDEPGSTLSAFPALHALIESCYAAVPGMPSGWSVYLRAGTECNPQGTEQ
jgi:hypothetical protein